LKNGCRNFKAQWGVNEVRGVKGVNEVRGV
jgi:hypothetical protein